MIGRRGGSDGSDKPKSKPATYLTIGSQAYGAVSVARKVKEARGKGDRLELVNAVLKAAVLVTGVALLVRELRHAGDDDVLAD